jgi:hypothetical protein
MAGVGVISQIVGFVAQKVLPQFSPDNPVAAQNIRLGSYGEVAVNQYLSKKFGAAAEGSYYTTVTTPGGQVVVPAIVTSYANTAGVFWFQNNNPAGGRTAYLDYLKLTCTTVPASTTQFRYAIIRDTAQPLAGTSYLTTNNSSTAVPVNTTAAGTASGCLVGYQSAVTANVNTAPTSNGAVIACGSLGGLPIVGDEFVIDFGGDQAVSYGATSVASRKISAAPAIALAPGQQIMIVPWWFGNSSTGGKYDMEFAHIER